MTVGRFLVPIVVVVCALVVLPCAAQSGEGGHQTEGAVPVNSGEAIPVGPFLFSPAVQLTWEHRDNIFFSPDREVADQIYLARARMMFELPVYDSYVRFTYVPQWRDYKNYEFEENWSHFVDIGSDFEFANGLRLATAYRFVSGNMETREVDPGGEFIWGEFQYRKHFLSVAAEYWLNQTNGLMVEGGLTDMSYEDVPLFYDYSRTQVGVGYLRQLNPTVVLDLKYRREDFDAAEAVDFRDSTTDELTIGLKGQITAVFSSEIRAGVRHTAFDLRPGDPDVEDFQGFVVNGSLRWEMAHGSTLRLDLLRWDYPSQYGENAYYTASGGSLIYNLNRGRLYGQARVRLQNNSYELQDPATPGKRSDDITTFGLGLGYRFTDLLSLRGSYLHEDRDTLYPFNYEVKIFVLGLIFGF
jgi:hypothetical protein